MVIIPLIDIVLILYYYDLYFNRVLLTSILLSIVRLQFVCWIPLNKTFKSGSIASHER